MDFEINWFHFFGVVVVNWIPYGLWCPCPIPGWIPSVVLLPVHSTKFLSTFLYLLNRLYWCYSLLTNYFKSVVMNHTTQAIPCKLFLLNCRMTLHCCLMVDGKKYGALFDNKRKLKEHLSPAPHRALRVICPFCCDKENSFNKAGDLKPMSQSATRMPL